MGHTCILRQPQIRQDRASVSDGAFDPAVVPDTDVLPLLFSRMAQLLAHMPTLTRVSRVEKERAESFIDDTERIVLVGEAAYPKGVRTPHTMAPLYC